jgi:hypothetical protein
MTTFRQIEANRRNALKSTGPTTAEGKQQSRRNALRHGLTAETVIGSLEDVEDYKAFESAIIADYDAQSAVERELVLRLASLLWRLRRATTMETGLLEMQAEHLRESRPRMPEDSGESLDALLRRANWVAADGGQALDGIPNSARGLPTSTPLPVDPRPNLARCFLRLADLPNCALDRLSRYEAVLWRQAAQILFALSAFGRRKPQERERYFHFRRRHDPSFGDDER